MKSKCLTDEEIAAYVDGTADGGTRLKVENHIAHCRLCLHSIAEVKQLSDANEESPVHIPDSALSRALGLIEAAARPLPEFSIVAAVREGLVKIVRTTGDLLPPPRLEPVAVRGTRTPGLIPRVAKSMGGCFVTVEVGCRPEGVTADILIVDEESRERPDGVKVKLHTGGESLTKYSRSGKVRFDSLPEGVCDLDLEGIGRIRLEID